MQVDHSLVEELHERRFFIAVETNAVVAILVVLLPADWVVAVDNLAAATVPAFKFPAFL